MYCIADVLFGCVLHSSLYYFAMAHLTDALHTVARYIMMK